MDFSTILVGGSLWLDLVNTIYMTSGEKQDVLKTEVSAKEWLIQSRLVPQGLATEDDALLIKRLTALRHLFLNLIVDMEKTGTFSEAFINQIDQVASSLKLHMTVGYKEGSLYEEIKGSTIQEDILFKIMHSFTDTVKNVSYGRIKQCHHEECILYFLDLSKSGKRKWCSMETCGNRVKASKFYANKKLK